MFVVCFFFVFLRNNTYAVASEIGKFYTSIVRKFNGNPFACVLKKKKSFKIDIALLKEYK